MENKSGPVEDPLGLSWGELTERRGELNTTPGSYNVISFTLSDRRVL